MTIVTQLLKFLNKFGKFLIFTFSNKRGMLKHIELSRNNTDNHKKILAGAAILYLIRANKCQINC